MTVLQQYKNQIAKIYLNNFPDYLRDSLSDFKKSINKYNYWDLLIDNGNEIVNLNSKLVPIGLKSKKGLNKQQTYLYPPFSGALQKTTIAGFALLNFYPKYSLVHLDYVSLDKNYQGKGNGTKYLSHIIQTYYLNNKKVKYMVLECENHLVKFYEKNGFVKINFNYWYKGVRMNLMIYNKNNLNQIIKYKIAEYLSVIFGVSFQIKEFIIKFIECFYANFRNWKIMNLNLEFKNQLKYHIFDNFKKKT